MRAISKYDETASESTEVEHQPAFGVSRKSFAVGVCAVLAVTAIGASKWSHVTETVASLNGNDFIEMAAACSDDVSNCLESKCCKNSGRKCYMKNEYWATCNDTCDEGHIDSYDAAHNISAGWNCSVIEKPKECSTDSESCAESGCCKNENSVCFIKNEWWANCNDICKPGPHPYEHPDYVGDEWKCEIHMMPCESEDGKPKDQLKCCIDFACKGKADDTKCIEDRCGFYQEMTDDKEGTTTTVAPDDNETETTAAPSPA